MQKTLSQFVIVPTVALVALFCIALWATPLSHGKVTEHPISAMALREALSACGLTPANLAGAGVSDDSSAAVVRRMKLALKARPTPLATLAREQRVTGAALRDANVLLRQGAVRSGDRVTAAAAAHTAAEALYQSELNALRALACDGLQSGQLALLDQISSPERHGMPVEYRALRCAADEWESLQQAHRHRIAVERLGRPLHPRFAAILATADSDPLVVTVKRNRDRLLQDVTAAWEGAVQRFGDRVDPE